LRSVCSACQHIQYVNPRIVVGTVCEWEGRILLCKRAIEPRLGYWTLPAGFMECGESTLEGAQRETLEEAGAKVRLDALFAVIDVPQVEQVHMFYRGVMIDGQFASGEESLETRLVEESDIPWKDMAFKTVSLALEWYLSDRRKGVFSLHQDVLRR
jgi:ADP-ribose pyrophosphatase YjhB (NUDIX family)